MFVIADITAPEAVSQSQELLHEGLPMAADHLFNVGPLEVTNSALVAYGVAALLIIVAQAGMSNAKLRPSGLQNFVELAVESLNGILTSILGSELARKTAWFFSSIFIFILVSNWIGLVPGVGSIGWGHETSTGEFEVTKGIFRGANADVNMTLSLALIFFGLWIYWTLRANGLAGTFWHIFGAKGGQKGALGWILAGVFFLVGFIEVLSILVRPISLTFRLYGNVYGGEQMIDKFMHLVPGLSWLVPLPIYFFELLVGLVQALVFFLLTAVFTAMSCRHDESHHKEPTHH